MVTSFDFEHAPGHLIRRAHQLAVAIFMDETADFEITPVQFAILNALIDTPGEDQVTLAGRVAFDAATSGSVIGRLELRGWIRREVDPLDKRRKLLWVTPAGADAADHMKRIVTRVQARILAPLDGQEQAQLVSLLAKLVAGHEAQNRVLGAGRAQADFVTSSKCSTTGGAAKKGPTMARHSANSGDWRKPTVWSSSVVQKICST